ncbi:MAG: ABC transporter ATPase [Lactococcus sp.]|jgi:hypothetical protein
MASEKSSQEKLYSTTLQLIGTVSKLPIVRVDRETFLRKQFSNSEFLDKIIQDGPQSVYTVESLRKKADGIIKTSTNKTSLTSFVTGLPSNPLTMTLAGSADVVQYFGFALNMAQQIAYLFGEESLFEGRTDHVSEKTQIRVIAYLGVMLGAGGAASLVASTSKIAGQNLGKKIAAKALTKTAWYPLVKKIGAIIGQKVTKKTVEKVISKSIPIAGGVISGGLTYLTYRPMGNRLADTLVRNIKGDFDKDLELNPDFLKRAAQNDELIGEFTEVDSD